MKKLHFETTINAPVQKVWHTMLDDKTYREWTSAFMPDSHNDSHYEGSWDKDSDIRFVGTEEDGTLSGMLGKIIENKPYEFLSIKYHGMIMHGVEDTTSDQVKKWTGGLESYTFKEVDGKTELQIDLDVAEEMADEFSEMWPRGLEKLKEIAEK